MYRSDEAGLVIYVTFEVPPSVFPCQFAALGRELMGSIISRLCPPAPAISVALLGANVRGPG